MLSMISISMHACNVQPCVTPILTNQLKSFLKYVFRTQPNLFLFFLSANLLSNIASVHRNGDHGKHEADANLINKEFITSSFKM